MSYVIKTSDNRVIRFEGGETAPDVAPLVAEYIAGPAPFFPNPPVPRAVLLWVSGGPKWLDVRTLAEAKVDRWAAIKAERTSREDSGFAWSGSRFDSNPEARAAIYGEATAAQIAIAAAQAWSADWTLEDNTARTLTAADMLAVASRLSQKLATVRDKARALRVQINAATTIAAVDAITWV